MMKIYYASAEEFYEGMYEIVKLGLTFDAHARDLTITLTGGF
jgi:hypothetical protein